MLTYKSQSVQTLNEGDKQNSSKLLTVVLHAECLLRILPKTSPFDKCKFCVYILVNKQIVTIWGVERPDENNTVIMNIPSIIKCWAKSKTFSKALVFHNEKVTGDSYRNMLIH